MWNLITSYIVQSGECVLPGIGTFTLVTTPATLDVVNKEMLPPHTEFRFTDKTGQPTDKRKDFFRRNDLIQFYWDFT